ncbi:flavin reductase [Bacteroidota bacterium]
MIQYEAFFKVSYGLFIVSSGNKENGNGYISNTVFQVTANPPKFATCCSKDNYTCNIIKENKAFGVSVLEQETSSQLIGKFGYNSGRDVKKFEDIKFKTGKTGIPIAMDHTIATFECKVEEIMDVGTHLLFIGEVVEAVLLSDKDPITYEYYRKVKKGLSPKNAPTYIDKNKLENKKEGGDKYKCPVCGYVYDPESGDDSSDVAPGTSFDDLPSGWICPVCGIEKDEFTKL